MSICFVLEGGAMRGNFTGGVLDYLYEHGFPRADCLVCTSAGGLAGISYVTRQVGRAVRINTTYCTNWRFLSIKSWLLTGDAFGSDFYFNKITYEYDPLDFDTLEHDPTRFVVCATNLATGKAFYHDVRHPEDLVYLQASTAMPVINRTVRAGGLELVDGGTADSIPLQWALDESFDKVIVVLTQDRSYRKSPQEMMGIIRLRYRKYPRFIEAVESRRERYDACREQIFKLEVDGRIAVLTPKKPVSIGRMTQDPAAIMALYNEGRQVAEENFGSLLEYVGADAKSAH